MITQLHTIKFIDSFRFMQAYYKVLLIHFLEDFTMINAKIVSLVLNTYKSKIVHQYLIVENIIKTIKSISIKI